jgi:hypothetical protein
MPIVSPSLPPIPPPQVPLVDPRTGLVSTEWYNFLRGVEQLLRLALARVP